YQGLNASNLTMTAGSDVQVSGGGVSLTNGTIAGQNITVNASVASGTALSMTGVTLNASRASLSGSNRGTGTGFTLSNLTWQGGLTDINNITLSSAGSAASVINRLGVGVVDSSKLITLMKKGIENTTYVDKSLNDVVKSSLSVDGNGDINATFGSGDRPGAWTFDGIDLNATRNINLSGIGLTNSTLQAGGGLTINDGNSLLNLSGSNMTAGQNISLTGNGGITLTKSDIAAGNDITMLASNGSVNISGASTTDRANVTSTAGSITVNGAVKGYYTGVRITNTDISATKGVITVSGASDNALSPGSGAVMLGGQSSFNSTFTSVTGTDTNTVAASWSGGIAIEAGSNIAFYGNTSITGSSAGNAGLIFLGGYYATPTKLTFSDGIVNVQGYANTNSTPYAFLSGIAFVAWESLPQTIYFNLSNATLNLSAYGNKVPGFRLDITAPAWDKTNNKGFIFTGNGSVNINGVSGTSTGVEARILDNTGLNGTFTVTGESTSGVGVNFSRNVNATLVNATITGKSGSGVGVSITTGDTYSKVADLNNNTITGTSDTSSGILINGNNVTITNGSLNGTSAGTGAGVALTGGTDYTIDGAVISGQSADGAGISASGNLSANNNATLSGTATGSGSGVTVNGSLASNGGVTISGAATSGDGVQVSGDTLLSNATVTGTTDTGSGIHVSGNLTNSNTTLAGEASGQGAGVEIGGNISGGMVTGLSDTGDGVLVSGGASTVTNAVITGNTTTGTGVTISGNLTNAGNTTVSGSAAGNGAGVELGGNVTGGSVSGSSDTGTGVIVTGDNSSATDAAITGNTTTGTGVTISGNLTNAGNTTVSGSAAGNGTGVALNGTLNGTVSGTSDGGVGAHISDGAIITDGSQVSGSSAQGSGTVVSGGITNNGSIAGNSINGDGLVLNSTVAGGGSLSGDSTNGAGAHITGDTHLAGGSLSGTTTNGSGMQLDGILTHTNDSQVDISVQPGGSGSSYSGNGRLQSTTENGRQFARHQQSVISQVPHARPLTQSAGYQAAPQPLDISLCSGEGPCRSLTVNQTLTATPQAGKATSGPEKAAP
ncbi:large exoproteins involved in heme utilization or adhesion, partial [Salmonella enterica subsp. enterica serovar Miami str. 1923]|uniref:beta strand repeat-containing protein n=1 Tax=Salmonella enterica TaxID=28901 RepID=UPI0003BDC2AA